MTGEPARAADAIRDCRAGQLNSRQHRAESSGDGRPCPVFRVRCVGWERAVTGEPARAADAIRDRRIGQLNSRQHRAESSGDGRPRPVFRVRCVGWELAVTGEPARTADAIRDCRAGHMNNMKRAESSGIGKLRPVACGFLFLGECAVTDCNREHAVSIAVR